MNETDSDFAGETDHAAGERSSQSGFFEIFIAERDRLRRIVAGMGLGPADVEDVLQDVSIRVMRRSPKCQSPEDAVRWLVRVTINLCLMEHRRRKRFGRNASAILKRRSETLGRPERAQENIIRAEELEIVRESLQELDDSLLAALVLRYFCDLNSTEIGRVLRLSASTVRSRLREGRMILARRLTERGVEP